ncbi:putative restriction endonuclease [Streptomyces sp. Amel2xB2]|nr:putative restriction endonuclease [Streptomyces sp. Amel2xB2]
MEECRLLGRPEFRREHGFGQATAYELVLDGARYDSKAVVGVAHQYSAGSPLNAEDFSGGAHTVARRLRALGFTVEHPSSASEAAETSVPQLLLQPRGGPRARGPQNFAHSVTRGVPIADLRGVLGEHGDVLDALYPDGIARLWGSTPTDQANNGKAKALRGRRVGDDVLFYAGKHFIARARILHLFDSSPVAKAVWGTNEDGATWEHVMALGDLEEFPAPVQAEPILRSLNVPVPLRGLTLRSAQDYHGVARLLPERIPSPPLRSSADTASAAASALTDDADLLTRLGSLRTHRHSGAQHPSRHQPLTLLWAISRIAAGKPRLAPWSTFRAEVSPLLAEFGLTGSNVTPEYPFWHLRGSGLWEVHGIPDDAGAMPQTGVFNAVEAVAGLTHAAAKLLRDPATRLEAVLRLCRTYLVGVDPRALLDRVGLAGYVPADGLLDPFESRAEQEAADEEAASGPAARRESFVSRLVRYRALAQEVKDLHGNACQVCGTCLRYNRKPYSQAAHIRALGSPHDGPDELSNLLCLCPNHHVLFDGLEIYVDADDGVRWTDGGESLGSLRRLPRHPINEAHLRYHRSLCSLTARDSSS